MSNKQDVQKLVESYVNEVWNSPATDNNISPTVVSIDKEDKEESCEGMEVKPAVTNNGETDARMAKSELYKILKYAKELHDSIQDEENLEPWIFSKITLAGNYLDSVKHYMDYENYRKTEETPTCGHGENIVMKLKSMLHGESKAVVEQVMRHVIFSLEALQTIEETKK